MSHVTVTKLKLEGLNENLFGRVMNKIAEKFGAKVVGEESIKDYNGRSTLNSISKDATLRVGIKGGAFKFGVIVAANKETGEVEIAGDFWGSGVDSVQLTNMVGTEYVKEGISDALYDIGMDVTNVVENDDEILIEAEEVM